MKIIFPLVLIFFVSFVFFPRELYVHKVFFVLENDKLIKKRTFRMFFVIVLKVSFLSFKIIL